MERERQAERDVDGYTFEEKLFRSDRENKNATAAIAMQHKPTKDHPKRKKGEGGRYWLESTANRASGSHRFILSL